MFFDNIKISSFGPFPELTIHFNPKGVNAIIGPNASGKTQLIGAIAISLFGKGAKATSERTGESTLRLEIRNGENHEAINTKIEKNSHPLRISRSVDASLQQQVSTGFSQQLLKMLADIDGPNLFLTRESMSHPAPIADDDIERIDQVFEGDQSLITLRPQIRDALKSRSNRNHSIGMSWLLTLINEYLLRERSGISIPLIIDDAGSVFDTPAWVMALRMISRIGQRDQVILTTARPLASGFEAKTHELSIPRASPGSAICFDYSFLGNMEKVRRARIKRLAVRPFLLGKQFTHEENRYCEFKEVKGNNPIGSIHRLADQYVVAYLNAEGRGKVGRILWGIKDDGVVVGVKLTQGMRDELRRVITENLLKIEPSLAPTEYRIELHAVYEQDRRIQDLFVVEIVVPIATHKYLYSTGNGEVYIKTDAGKKRLRPIEIQEEILKRHKVKS